MRTLSAVASGLLALVLSAPTPLLADEFEDVMESALSAYREGDMAAAREDLDYAVTLLQEMKAAGLVEHLPPPLPGWVREEADAQNAGAAFAMLGGGVTAAARYVRGSDDFTITLVANSPMVSGIAAMVSGMGAMGGGRTVRIQREQFVVNESEIQGVVDGAVLVQASGSASAEDMQAHIEAMDLPALGAF
jgi:hypothetical protein